MAKLYVIFHGEFAFKDDPTDLKNMVVQTPDMSAMPGMPAACGAHVYLAGPWLGERTVPRGSSLQLTGVSLEGRQCIRDAANKDRFIIFKHKPSPMAGAQAYFTVTMPRPEKMKPGFVVQLPTNAIVSTDLEEIPKAVDLHPVFQYEVEDGKTPGLLDPSTSLTWNASETISGVWSLHLVASLDRLLPGSLQTTHEIMAFQGASALLGATAKPRAGVLPGAAKVYRLRGLHRDELKLRYTDWLENQRIMGDELREHLPARWKGKADPVKFPGRMGASAGITCFLPGNCGPVGG